MADKKIRSIAKTFSWRFIIFVYWVIFGYIYTGTFTGAGILGVGSIVPLFFTIFMREFGTRLNGELVNINLLISIQKKI